LHSAPGETRSMVTLWVLPHAARPNAKRPTRNLFTVSPSRRALRAAREVYNS
jgi:hypothetical protein